MEVSIIAIIADVFSVTSLTAMFAGVVVGLVLGALPGFSANMGVALLLPVTFTLPPVPALIMLTSLYTAAIYGGSFSAILLYTPGTSASAATALDGYPLTCKGESNKALRIATFSSVFGGAASALALLTLAPPLSYISLLFGPAEYFFLALFGLTIIGGLASGNVLKGLLAGLLGLMFSLVGIDLDSGFPRYTFGMTGLLGGVAFVPAVIGLFSMTQVLVMCESTDEAIQEASIPQNNAWRLLPTLDELREIRATVLRSSLIGVFVGILPAAGADIGSWTSYNEAKRFSKNKELFGKGSIEGIAASETANNAVTGSSLIPMLTLGIPGSSTAAIMLGALVMHGLVPGRELFTKYGDITYTVIIGFFFANFLMGIVGMGLARRVTVVAKLPKYVLIVPIILFSVVGSFSISNSMFDVFVMLVFGLLGYIMRKVDIPAAPMVLGMILGPIAEQGLRQALILSHGDLGAYLLKSPISIVLMLLIAASLITTALVSRRKPKKTI